MPGAAAPSISFPNLITDGSRSDSNFNAKGVYVFLGMISLTSANNSRILETNSALLSL